MTDIAQVNVRANHLDTEAHGVVTDLRHPPADDGWITDEHHLAGVAVVAVLYDGDIDIQDVAGLELALARDAVTHLMIDRGADRLGKTLVIERRRGRLLHVDDVIVADTVEFCGGDARLHMRADHVQHVGRQATGDAHLLDFLGCLDGDGHVIRRRSWAVHFSLLLPILIDCCPEPSMV
jgi:hypothetical protein